MRLKNLKYPDLRDDKKYNFIFPVGSLEQHGPFAPFGTDTIITDYIIDQVEKVFPDLIILPTLEFSRAEEHRGFFGTVYLTANTLKMVINDICNSLYKKADHIFLASFHANDVYFNEFIKESTQKFKPAKIINLELYEEDESELEKLLQGPVDGHAGNSEISNILAINENLASLPPQDYPKKVVENPFSTNNLKEKCPDGIADNHPDWVVNKEVGQKILDEYCKTTIKNIKRYLG